MLAKDLYTGSYFEKSAYTFAPSPKYTFAPSPKYTFKKAYTFDPVPPMNSPFRAAMSSDNDAQQKSKIDLRSFAAIVSMIKKNPTSFNQDTLDSYRDFAERNGVSDLGELTDATHRFNKELEEGN